MTRWIASNSAHVSAVLLTCVALTMSGVLQAQAHPDAPEPPDVRMLVLARDRPGDEEIRDANPCYRDRFMWRVDWQREAWLSFCVQRLRSRFASTAWRRGFDTHGEPLEADAPARKLAEMDVWLRRITGKYRVEGKYWNSGGSSPVSGAADCFAIGTGPGVSCLLSTQYKAPKESAVGGGNGRLKDPRLDQVLYDAMRGLVFLFGIDPRASEIRATLVDFRATGTSGFLDEGVVMFQGRPNFEFPIMNPTITYTWSTTFVAAQPNGDLAVKLLVRASDIRTTPEPILFDLRLHREPVVTAK